jgi:hypothetical protein
MRDRRSSGAAGSQLHGVLHVSAWVGVLTGAAMVVGISLLAVVPLLFAAGARGVAGLPVSSVVSGSVYALPLAQPAILLRLGR